jgi:hypothetical protein
MLFYGQMLLWRDNSKRLFTSMIEPRHTLFRLAVTHPYLPILLP